MDHDHNQGPATAAYWASQERIGDGDTVPVTRPPRLGTLPPRRDLIWRLMALAPGLVLIATVIVGAVR
jgi:hypothetical protein